MQLTPDEQEMGKSTTKPTVKAPLADAAGSVSGVCIVCGSGLILKISQGGLNREFVHCNDCGSEVTLHMHQKKQPNTELTDRRGAGSVK